MVTISLIATLGAWHLTKQSVQERTLLNFVRQQEYAIDLFKQQMDRYADVLSAGAAFIASSAEVNPEEWRQFSKGIGLEDQLPAIGALGVLYRVETKDVAEFEKTQRLTRPDFAVHPAVDRSVMNANRYAMPITLIAPEALEATIPGLDVAQESRRRDAIERSIRYGTAQITAPIIPEGLSEAGFVIIAPIFATNMPATEALRQSEFIGAIVAVVITKNLASGILDSGMRQVALKVTDSSEIIYDELISENEELDPQPLMTGNKTVSFFGREWNFELHSTKTFRLAQHNTTPTLVLVAGLAIDTLLLLLFVHMFRANQRATDFGKEISEKYERQSQALEHRNNQLESFSFLVSHDLKAPLRAVSFLTDCIEEDIDEHKSTTVLPPELMQHVTRIKKQVTLAQSLIKGVLQYSGLGTDEEVIETVDVLELLNSLRVTLTVDDVQLQLQGKFPTFETYQTQLFQVFMNLVSNGFKYHNGPELAVVTVSACDSKLEGFYRFAVSDNGPGIKQEFHEKIFEPFATLQPKDHSMSSGVGLAIVKKLIVQHGGTITIDSSLDQGATFTFDWPCSVAEANECVVMSKAA